MVGGTYGISPPISNILSSPCSWAGAIPSCTAEVRNLSNALLGITLYFTKVGSVVRYSPRIYAREIGLGETSSLAHKHKQ